MVTECITRDHNLPYKPPLALVLEPAFACKYSLLLQYPFCNVTSPLTQPWQAYEISKLSLSPPCHDHDSWWISPSLRYINSHITQSSHFIWWRFVDVIQFLSKMKRSNSPPCGEKTHSVEKRSTHTLPKTDRNLKKKKTSCRWGKDVGSNY